MVNPSNRQINHFMVACYIVFYVIAFSITTAAQNIHPPTVNPCVWISSNDLCTNAIKLYVGAECTPGTNTGSGTTATTDTIPSSNECWLSRPNNTVWYKFVTSNACEYIISTDNGVAEFGSDTQLRLYEAKYNNCDSLILVACNDDGGNCNNLASAIKANLKKNTLYYIIVDQFGTGVGKFCINVNKTDQSSNDCIVQALDISDFVNGTGSTITTWNDILIIKKINGSGNDTIKSSVTTSKSNVLNACKPFNSQAYTYYKATSTHVNASNAGFTNSNCNGSNPVVNTIKFDIWFKYVYDNNAKNWISVYPNNGCNYYGIEAFKRTPSFSGTCSTANDLQYLACSLGDFNPSSCGNDGGARNKSRYSAQNHPRLDLTDMTGAPYNVVNGDTIYIRIWQYTRVDGNAGPNFGLAAPPIDAIFNLVAERAPIVNPFNGDTLSIDSLSHDRCIRPGKNTIGCDFGNGVIINGNVNDTRTCLTNAGLQGNVWTGSIGDNRTQSCSTSPFTNEPLQLITGLGSYQDNCSGTDVTPKGLIINPHYTAFYRFTVPKVSLPELPGLPLAQAHVQITLSHINAIGVNGNSLYAFVYPDSAGVCNFNQPVIMQATPLGCDSAVCFKPSTAGILPAGKYNLIIDGQSAQLLSYTLNLKITQVHPLTGFQIGDLCTNPSTARTTGLYMEKSASEALKLQHIKPVPAYDKLEVLYFSGSPGKLQIELINMIGQKVLTRSFSSGIGENIVELNISDIKPGIYILNMEQNGAKMQSRIVKIE